MVHETLSSCKPSLKLFPPFSCHSPSHYTNHHFLMSQIGSNSAKSQMHKEVRLIPMLNECFCDNPQGSQETKCFSQDIRRNSRWKSCILPSSQKAFLSLLQIHSTSHTEAGLVASLSRNANWGCVQEDRNRLYKMAARVIAWKEINSKPFHWEQSGFCFYICPLHELLGSGIQAFQWFIATGLTP